MARTHGRKGRPWRRLRAQVLLEEPWCTIRGPRCTGISTTADHLLPLSRFPHLAHTRSNLRGSCLRCNGSKHDRLPGQNRGPAPSRSTQLTW